MGHKEKEDAVGRQYDSFIAELPALLGQYQGKWAVYLDGLKETFDDEWVALRWASTNLGDDAPFTIVRVEEPRVVLLTAALAFRGRDR